MTLYAVRCPQCGSRLKFRDRRAFGRAVRCPKCGGKFRMPRPPDQRKPQAEPDPLDEKVPVAQPGLDEEPGRKVAARTDRLGSEPQQRGRSQQASLFSRKWLGLVVAAAAAVAVTSVWYMGGRRAGKPQPAAQKMAVRDESGTRVPNARSTGPTAQSGTTATTRSHVESTKEPGRGRATVTATAPREADLELPTLPPYVRRADAVLFEDGFDRSDPGSQWQVVAGQFAIDNGRIVLSDPGGGEIQCTQAVSPPCVVQVTLWQEHDPQKNVWQEPRAGIRLRSAAEFDKALTIRVSSGGTVEKAADPGERDRTILGACRSQPVTLLLEVTQSKVVVYANGGYVAEVRPAEGAPLKVSLFANKGEAAFDDFAIRQGTYRPAWRWDLSGVAEFLSPDVRTTLDEWAKAASQLRQRNVVQSRACRVTSDPSEGFARTVWHIQQQIKAAETPAERKTLAEKLERQVADFGLVTWYFNPWLLLRKGVLPPGLVDLKRLRVVCARNEIEPAAFYVTNLRTQPCRMEVVVDGLEGATAVYFVDASPEVSQNLIGIMTPISLSAVLDSSSALILPTPVIPPMESRQVWINVDTSRLEPGLHKFRVQVIPQDKTWPTKSVVVEVQVLPIQLPEMPPFDTFTYNFARERPELYVDLRRHKINWVSMGEPQWKLEDGKLVVDFTYLDQDLAVSRGKGPHLAIYGFIEKMAEKLKRDYKIPWDDPRTKRYIVEYARQWAAHLEELGMTPDQYMWEIYDEPRTKEEFARLREIVPLLKEAVPQVRFALDPLTKDPQLYREMGPYIDLWIPHHAMVYTVDPLRDPTTVAQRMPKVSTAATLGVLLKNRKEGSRLWCYMQYAHHEQAYRECPAAVFRHYVWRIIWGLKADGVSFHAHWYASGQMKRPCKGWEAFREGIEDLQWALMLQKAVEEGKVDAQLGRRALQAVDRLGCGLDWWLEQPVERSEDMDWARLVAMQALLGQSVPLPENRKRRVFGSMSK